MKKCASYSARAGESNAIFSSRIGPILTNPHSILSLRTHPVGFFRNFAHTHTRVRFFVKIDPCWKINKNSEKCEKMCIRFSAQGWPGWCRGPDLGDFIDLHRHQQQPVRTTTSTPVHPVGSFGDCAKMNKNRKKHEKMCIILGACRGVECNLHQPDWPPSHQATHPSSPHWVLFENFAHTHMGRFLSKSIDGGKSTKIQKNVEKCAFDSAHRVGPRGVEFQIWVTSSISTATGTDCIHSSPPRWKFRRLCKNE